MTNTSPAATLPPTMSFKVRKLSDEKKRRSLPWKQMFALGMLVGKPMIESWVEDRNEKKKEEHRKSLRVRILKQIFIVLIAVLCAAALFAGATKAMISLKMIDLGTILDTAGTDLPTDAYGHTNLLLLGQGDESHQGYDLTDTIMVASIDPSDTNSVAMLSIPRDLYLTKTERMGMGRINAMYRNMKSFYMSREDLDEAAAGQKALRDLADELERMLGMDIHGIVKVDFIAFTQTVDAVGGIDVFVEEALFDNQYPGPRGSYVTFSVDAGLQHFDGETALKYARSRHSTSDFDRSRRQQQIIGALADKMREAGLFSKPNQIIDLVNIIRENMETTLTVREMIGLAGIGTDIERDRIATMQLNDAAGTLMHLARPGGFLYPPPRDQFGGASVMLPVGSDGEPWIQVRTLAKLFLHDRMFLQSAPIIIENAGAPSGTASRLGAELVRYGFEVEDARNAEEDRPLSSIEAWEPSKDAAEALSALLKIPLTLREADSVSGALLPLSVTLGEDYQFTPLHQLTQAPPPIDDTTTDNR